MKLTDCVELMPCPFCGADANAFEIPALEHFIVDIPNYSDRGLAVCTKCTAAVSGTDLKNAIENWNRRV